VVPRPLPAAPLVVRHRYLNLALTPLPRCAWQVLGCGAQNDARGAAEILERGAQAAARGDARCASQVLGRCAQADARGAAQVLDHGAQVVARGAARCASQLLDR
jgi:hypothetical protein